MILLSISKVVQNEDNMDKGMGKHTIRVILYSVSKMILSNITKVILFEQICKKIQ